MLELYDRAWFDSLARFRPFNETAFWAIIAHLGRPTSYLDVGCGDGWMVRAAHMVGCKPAVGLEVPGATRWIRRPRPYDIREHDLRDPFEIDATFSLVTCIEVGEHLPPESADILVSSLARAVAPDGWLVFTAAAPGQGGEGHTNCQPQEYWRWRIEREGLVYLPDTTSRLRATWDYTTGPMFWLPQNLQVFHRG